MRFRFVLKGVISFCESIIYIKSFVSEIRRLQRKKTRQMKKNVFERKTKTEENRNFLYEFQLNDGMMFWCGVKSRGEISCYLRDQIVVTWKWLDKHKTTYAHTHTFVHTDTLLPHKSLIILLSWYGQIYIELYELLFLHFYALIYTRFGFVFHSLIVVLFSVSTYMHFDWRDPNKY